MEIGSAWLVSSRQQVMWGVPFMHWLLPSRQRFCQCSAKPMKQLFFFTLSFRHVKKIEIKAELAKKQLVRLQKLLDLSIKSRLTAPMGVLCDPQNNSSSTVCLKPEYCRRLKQYTSMRWQAGLLHNTGLFIYLY